MTINIEQAQQELDGMKAHIASLPEHQQAEVRMWAEEIRDCLSEGGQLALNALALVSCEVALIHHQQDASDEPSNP